MLVSISGAAKSIIPYGFHSVTFFFLGFRSTLLTSVPASPFQSLQTNKPTNQPTTPLKKTQTRYISIFLILLVLWARSCQQLQKLPSLHLNSRNSSLFGSQIKSNCCLFHCPDKFFINCVRSLWGRERGERKKKAVQECGLGKVPMINGVAVTSRYLKIHRCQLPGGFCCLWQLVIVIGRLLLCTS